MPTHGKQLVKALTETLPANLKFTTEETITLADIEQAGDRLEVLRAGSPPRRGSRRDAQPAGCRVSAEIRLLEDSIGRWIKWLNAHGPADGRLPAAQAGRHDPGGMALMPEARNSPNARLRDYLHARPVRFRRSIENKALAQKDTALATEARRVHQEKLDALWRTRK